MCSMTLLFAILGLCATSIQVHTYVGCFEDSLGLTDMGQHVFQSRGLCSKKCDNINQWVMGLTNGTYCLCGVHIPPMESLVSEEECNMRCSGYAMDTCRLSLYPLVVRMGRDRSYHTQVVVSGLYQYGLRNQRWKRKFHFRF